MLPPLDEIRESFAWLDDWEDRYRFLLELGRSVPALPAADRIDANLVRGCQSQVWMVGRFDPAANRIELALDSDAHIVRGLIAIVLAAYEGRTPADVLDFDIEALFEELDLIRHLSPTRGNGLRAMIERIRAFARQCAGPKVEASARNI